MKNDSKPLMQMSEPEFEEAFDSIESPINESIIGEARTSDNRVTIAATVLTLPDGTRRISYPIIEYGDGEGFRAASEFVDQCRRQGQLKTGESVEVKTFTFEIKLDQEGETV